MKNEIDLSTGLSTDALILKNNYFFAKEQDNIMNPTNYLFIGDYVGSNLKNTSLEKIDSSNSSDHQFVAASFSNEISLSNMFNMDGGNKFKINNLKSSSIFFSFLLRPFFHISG